MLFFRVNIIFVFDGHKYLASLYLLLFNILHVWFKNVSIVSLNYFSNIFSDYYVSPKVALAEKEARHLRWFQQEREKRIEQRGIYKLILLGADSLLGAWLHV